MAVVNNERKEYKFLWFIENYSYCWQKNGEILTSPKFTFDILGGTDWDVMLYPKGFGNENRDSISLFLRRYQKDSGPEDTSIKYQLSVLAADGSDLHSKEFKSPIKAGIGKGFHNFLQTDEIHLRRKAEFLPKDTLSVCCKMWSGEGDVHNVIQISARTRILTEKISFLHVVEDFSHLEPDVKQNIQVQSHSKKGRFISSNLYFPNCSCCEEKLRIEIVPSDARHILHQCKFFLLDVTGNIIDCGGVDYGYDAEKTGIHKLPLSLTRKIVLDRRSKYLPDDKLSLLCECNFSIGLMTQTIEETLYELPLAVVTQKNNHVHNKDICKAVEKFSGYPSISEDMKTIYINECLTDVELKTKTKSFKAHKNVLCARSPVFKAMMTSDMKEKNTASIQVDDLENDTVQQLLLFLYSDSLETLQWKSATQLYYAADKYHIGKLKAMCSSFLTENLNASNASDLLLLADTHNDCDLRKDVEDFILEHEEQVFGSSGWEKLIEKNPLLVIKTMHLKYKRKNEAN